MISLTCTSCKKVLEIDDAFAGGVCRCQYCGTIQTVPASVKRGARPGGPVTTSAAGPRSLYTKKAATKPPPPPSAHPPAAAASTESDGAEDVAAKAHRAARPIGTAGPTADRKRTWVIGAAIGAGVALLIGMIAWIAS